jgi:hypothetical protein
MNNKKELHIFPEAKKSAYYEDYTRVTYKLEELVNNLKNYNVSVEIRGPLGVVKMKNHIIFTTSGGQTLAVVEGYLAGLWTGITLK